MTTEAVFAQVDIVAQRRDEQTTILRSADVLRDCPQSLTSHLVLWAERAPGRIFLAERDANGAWERLCYAEALDKVLRLAQALTGLGLGPDRPLAILSGNSIPHALLSLAAMHVGIPVVPVSPAYSLISTDFAKLRYILNLIEPGAIFVDRFEPFKAALEAVSAASLGLIRGDGNGDGLPFEDLLEQPVGNGNVEKAQAAVTSDTIAKILFTSGSTGMPKGVVNTHRMLCSNQQALAQCWPFVELDPPVLVDWLPWSHTFGANHNFNLVLRNGGTLYIDAGKPAPGAVKTTVANLMEVSPTIYFNVPAGYEALLPFLEQDTAFARKFFSRLKLIFYAAAALPQSSWERLTTLSRRASGRDIPITSAWGSTETGPLATSVHFHVERSSAIGVPIPGTEIKLVSLQDRLEARVRGPNVMPGYFRNPEATASAFDEEGYFRSGDAVTLYECDKPERGLVFNGRISENFKLTSGTWVNVGMVRTAFVEALSPLLQDVVIAGEGQGQLAALAFPNETACRAIATDMHPNAPLAELLRSGRLLRELRHRISLYNSKWPAGSTRIAKLLLLEASPDIDAGEITDKGYLNQKVALKHRAEAVRKLFSNAPGVIHAN